MQITIEEINGKKYTVVWVNADPSADFPFYRAMRHKHGVQTYHTYCGTLLCTALPALPRRPKPEHAPLLHRYMAEGIEIQITDNETLSGEFICFDGEHCLTMDGIDFSEIQIKDCVIYNATVDNCPVEIAIEDNGNG